MPGALNRNRQLTLMARASAGYSAGQNLCSLRDKTAQFCDILVIDGFNFVYAEAANLFAAFASTRTAVIALGSITVCHNGNLLFSVFSVKWK